MKKRIEHIKSTKAEMYLDSIMVVFVIFLGLSIFITTLPIVVAKQQLDIVVKEAARLIEIEGSTGYIEYDIMDIGQRVGCVPDVIYPVDTVYYSGNRIQLREPFTLTIEKDVTFGGGIGPGITITLTSVAEGRSEVYWK